MAMVLVLLACARTAPFQRWRGLEQQSRRCNRFVLQAVISSWPREGDRHGQETPRGLCYYDKLLVQGRAGLAADSNGIRVNVQLYLILWLPRRTWYVGLGACWVHRPRGRHSR